jgi:amino acid transporter
MTTSAPPAPPTTPEPDIARKGLKLGAIGLLSGTVIAVASTAPAYSLTSALGSVAKEVGAKSPVVILLAFVPMLFVSYAYQALNRVHPDCGTSFTWVARAFGRHASWLTGWVIVVADVIVMANLAQIAASYTYQLLGLTGLAGSTWAVTVLGCAWILLMTVIAWVGIELSARTQVVLLSLELLVLAVFAVWALVRSHASLSGSLGWFLPTGLSAGALSAGFLAGVFIYWGWDSAVSINEETRDAKVNPGRVKLLVLAILVSSAASAQTTILPTARTTLAMAAYRALPRSFGAVPPRFQTPTVSTWAMGLVSVVFYAGLTALRPGALGDLILSIGPVDRVLLRPDRPGVVLVLPV